MEEKFRLELLSMIDRFADDNTVMMIDGCVCRLLRKYDINEKHTELCVLENENEKFLIHIELLCVLKVVHPVQFISIWIRLSTR